MDYKHIEQLLERYWQCETSIKEEEELRSFYLQEEIPLHLLPYKDLFIYQQAQQEITISKDFEERILAKIETPIVKAKRLTFVGRFMPLFRAVAVIAVIMAVGNGIQRSFYADQTLDYNYDTYTDTYDDPEVAYKQVSSALMMLSEGINKSENQHAGDSIEQRTKTNMIKE